MTRQELGFAANHPTRATRKAPLGAKKNEINSPARENEWSREEPSRNHPRVGSSNDAVTGITNRVGDRDLDEGPWDKRWRWCWYDFG